jgi:hypothetical protein
LVGRREGRRLRDEGQKRRRDESGGNGAASGEEVDDDFWREEVQTVLNGIVRVGIAGIGVGMLRVGVGGAAGGGSKIQGTRLGAGARWGLVQECALASFRREQLSDAGRRVRDSAAGPTGGEDLVRVESNPVRKPGREKNGGRPDIVERSGLASSRTEGRGSA